MFSVFIYIIAGLGAGIGTGFAGLSAAAIISPMLIIFLGFDPYQAVGIALASDVLASAATSFVYAKNKNIDIKHGVIMLVSVILATIIGSYLGYYVPDNTLKSFSVFITFFVGLKLIFKPVMKTKEKKVAGNKTIKSILSSVVIGLICGVFGAGGGMMLFIVLIGVLGYSLKKAVGTSVFIMIFTALSGAISHFVLGGMPNVTALIICTFSTLIGAAVASVIANDTKPKKLNRMTGTVMSGLGIIMIFMKFKQ